MQDLNKTCQEAVDKWGEDKQLDMVLEELAELMKAIVKYRRYEKNEVWRQKVMEEVADVQIMMVQTVFMLSSTSEHERVLRNKMINLQSLLKNDSPYRGLKNEDESKMV